MPGRDIYMYNIGNRVKEVEGVGRGGREREIGRGWVDGKRERKGWRVSKGGREGVERERRDGGREMAEREKGRDGGS